MIHTRKSSLWALIAMVALSSVAARAAEIDNPEYKMWSKYKPGTNVTTKTVSGSGEVQSEIQNTVTLKEVTDAKVVLETKMSMNAGGQKIDMPAQNRDIPARMTVADPVKIDMKDLPKSETKQSQETIKVAGKDVKCLYTESTIKTEKRTIMSKVWECSDIPGGMAKMESKAEGDTAMNMSMTVTDFTVK